MDLINTRLDSVARSEKDFYIQVFPTDDLFEWKWAYIAVDVTFMYVSLCFFKAALMMPFIYSKRQVEMGT